MFQKKGGGIQVIMADTLRPFEELVECPVCLSVPREGPVPACPVGRMSNKRVSNWKIKQTFYLLQDILFANLVESISGFVQHAEGR